MARRLEEFANTSEFLLVNPQRMVSARAFNRLARIIYLPEDKVLRKGQRFLLAVRTPILFFAQEDVAVGLSDDARLEPALRRHKRQRDIVLGAFSHERGTRPRIAKGRNLLKVMERKTR